MSRLLRTAAGLVIVLALTACVPTPTPVPTSSGTTAPSATPSPSATVSAPQPETVAADYLLEGTPGVPDADGAWKGHYGFFTDETKAVRCDLWIFSGDSGGVTCGVVPGSEHLVTYALPAADCGGANPADGYSVGINVKVFDTGSAGYTGCGAAAVDQSLASATRVLLDHQTLVVDSDLYAYTCTVAAGAATCSESQSGATITLGLHVAGFSG